MPAPYNSVLTKPDNLYTNLPRGGKRWGIVEKTGKFPSVFAYGRK